MKVDALVATTLVCGAAAFVAQIMYLAHIAPLRADLGIQVGGLLLIIWGGLIVSVLLKMAGAIGGWRRLRRQL